MSLTRGALAGAGSRGGKCTDWRGQPAAMQDPNEDTEWNDALRKHGIIGPREKTVRAL